MKLNFTKILTAIIMSASIYCGYLGYNNKVNKNDLLMRNIEALTYDEDDTIIYVDGGYWKYFCFQGECEWIFYGLTR